MLDSEFKKKIREASLPDTIFMEVLGVENTELPHTNFIAWLLTPEANHGLEEEFLKKFMEKISPEFTQKLNYDNVVVKLEESGEQGRLDIRFGNNSFQCIIENKINSPEGANQTTRYYNEYYEKLHAKNKFFVLLSKKGVPAKCDDFISLSYSDIRDILKTLEPIESKFGRLLIDDYIKNLEVNILQEFKGFRKKSKIYLDCFKDIKKVKKSWDKDVVQFFEVFNNKFIERYGQEKWKGKCDKKSFKMWRKRWNNSDEPHGVVYEVKFDIKSNRPLGIFLCTANVYRDYVDRFWSEFSNLPEIKNFEDQNIKKDESWNRFYRLNIEISFNDKEFDETVFNWLKDFENKFTNLVNQAISKIHN